jgi:endo-alpha-1,4-polygalactosaminidase (GH114 family)
MRLPSFLVPLALFFFPSLIHAQQLKWVCYYSDTAPFSTLSKFDLLIFDSDSHPAIAPLKQRGKTVIGYISIGEVNSTRSYYNEVKAQNLVLQENKNWPGSYFIDVRNPLWTRRVIEELIPKIIQKGFNGIFLDTIDNAPYLEEMDPQRFRGMSDAMVTLIKTIRRNFPTIKIIANRGFDILSKFEGDIDMVLGESIVPEQVRLLQDLKRRRPSVTILTLDYINPSDRNAVIQAYRRQRANGFNPYVSTRELNMVFEEPAP